MACTPGRVTRGCRCTDCVRTSEEKKELRQRRYREKKRDKKEKGQ